MKGQSLLHVIIRRMQQVSWCEHSILSCKCVVLCCLQPDLGHVGGGDFQVAGVSHELLADGVQHLLFLDQHTEREREGGRRRETTTDGQKTYRYTFCCMVGMNKYEQSNMYDIRILIIS